MTRFIPKPTDDLVPKGWPDVPELLSADQQHPLSVQDIIELAGKLEQYIDASTTEELNNSDVVYWLTQGLHYAVKELSEVAAKRIGQVMFKLAAKNPEGLISKLGDYIEFGVFKGQSTLFVWISELYSATFDVENNSAIIAINFILNYLFHHADNSPNRTINQELAQLLVKNSDLGVERGKNALLILTQAMLESAKYPNNQQQTLLITKLLVSCIAQSPSITNLALMQDIEHGPFQDKSIMYMLSRALQNPAKDNGPVVSIICNMMVNAMQAQVDVSWGHTMFKTIETGPFKGTQTLHIILNALLSAAYINNNDKTIDDITSVLQTLFFIAPNEMALALSEKIDKYNVDSGSGIKILVQTLVAAMAHNMDVTSIVGLLLSIINVDAKEMTVAFSDQFLSNSNQNINTSPLLQLIGLLRIGTQPAYLAQIKGLVQQLAASEYADDMLLQLPVDARPIFFHEDPELFRQSKQSELPRDEASSYFFKAKESSPTDDVPAISGFFPKK